MAKDPAELTLSHGVQGPAGKGATLQQVQGGSGLGHEKHIREEEKHAWPGLPCGRHHQQPALVQEPASCEWEDCYHGNRGKTEEMGYVLTI